MGSNMGEAHPIAFANVVKAKENGAKVMHVDPHYSRTSALANLYVPIRAGSDIVFLGAIIRHILENNGYFSDYVVNYTNAATLVREDFKDTEELDGLFSGYDADSETYTDQSSWDYERDKDGQPLSDPTLQHPRCVFQIMRRHYARYTPEMVEEVCGVPREQWLQVTQTLIENSGRERTTAICYAVGWTQQSKGVQIIRSAAMIQLLLGNIGRPGGGIMALRGHASIQGSTDIPTLYDLLSGYMPQPSALLTPVPSAKDLPGATTWGETRDAKSNELSQQTLEEYIDSVGSKAGLVVKHARLYAQFSARLVRGGRQRRRGQLQLSPDPQDYRGSLAPGYELRHAGRQGQGLLAFRAEPGGGQYQLAYAAQGVGATGLDGGARPVRG